MKFDYKFDVSVFESLIGGVSPLSMSKLSVQNLEEARQFTLAYGFDLEDKEDEKKLWSYYRKSIRFIQSEILEEGEEIPKILFDPNELKDLSYLLIYASTSDQRDFSLQQWSCALLKVMHVYVHLDNDLFASFSKEIQGQILKPIQAHVHEDPVAGIFLGSPSTSESIKLKKIELKAFKSIDSSVTKLLAKPEEVAFTILDKIGIRFITKHLFDCFRVMRFLLDRHLVSFPNNIPDQSNNTLYPVNLFFEVMESFTRNTEISPGEIDEKLVKKLESNQKRAQFLEKLNVFSSPDYKFIKFITRRRIKLELPQENKKRTLSFYYPFEVQIVDYETYLKNISGPASHEKYKKRQKRRARSRLFGLTEKKGL